MTDKKNSRDNDFFGIRGNSKVLNDVFTKIEQVAPEDVTVLIIGESGVGKELVARAIHRLSQRADGPFLPVNMGAMATEIASSEIFGHEKGAFTGASESREGLFTAANDGTLFLDEVGSMDHKTQTALLRILENRVFRKVGGKKTHETNARIIAANDRDLRQDVKEKKFRRDLLYRLEVFTIHVPPLRDRPEDIPILVDGFMKQFNHEMEKEDICHITDAALDCLLQYRWPGNVRELKNVIQSAMLLITDQNSITPDHLPARLKADDGKARVSGIPPGLSLKDVEKIYITQTLRLTEGNKSAAAKSLGVSRRYLYNKIEEYDISV